MDIMSSTHPKYRRLQLLTISLLLWILFITVLPSSSGLASGSPFRATGTYTEDFTTSTFQDSLATTTEGWGNGAISNPRYYYITKTANYTTPYPVRSLDVQGRKAYAVLYDPTVGLDSFRIFNISDVNIIDPLDTISPADYLLSVEVEGDVGFVGDSDGTPWIGAYNISNPYQITGLDVILPGGNGKITDFEIQGHFLYVSVFGSTTNDLAIIDIEDPSQLAGVGGVALSEFLGLEVQGQLAFLAEGTNGLSIYNVSNPSSVTSLGSVNTPGNATDVLVDGTIAYVADGPSGVQIVDVSDTATPTILGSYNTPGNAQRLALQGHTLFVADLTGGIQILDVSNPTNVIYVDAISGITAYDAALFGEHIVIGTADDIQIYRVGMVATDLPLVGSYSTYEAWDVVVQGDTAFVAAGADGLLALDVNDPANPTLITQYSHATTVNYIAIDAQGPYCFVLDTSSVSASRGLWAVDVSDPANPIFRSRRHFSEGYGLCVDGDVACVADGTYGLILVNISNPFNINVDIDIVGHGYNYTAVHKQGHSIYCTANDFSTFTDRGLYVYDATDLSNLKLTSHLELTYLEGVDVKGDFCALADGSFGTYLVNVTDPWSISTWLDSYDPPGNNRTYDVAIFGDYILATERQGGIYLLSAEYPTHIQQLANYTDAGMAALRLSIHGDYAYVANRDSLLIFRFLRSAADTFITTCVAQSLAVDTTTNPIDTATLTYTGQTPSGTALTWYISGDGGLNWEPITPGTPLTINHTGSDLRWCVVLSSVNDYNTAVITGVTITYTEFIVPPDLTLILIIVVVAIIIVVAIVLILIWKRRRK